MSFRSLYRHGFARVAACTTRTALADPATNAQAILDHGATATARRWRWRCFPNSACPATRSATCCSRRRCWMPWRPRSRRIVAGSAELMPLLLVGAPLRHSARCTTAPLAIHRGRLLGVVPKIHLPNYREFYEKRHFVSGDGTDGRVDHHCWRTPRRSAPICCSKPPTCRGFVVHVEICEDVWAPNPPSGEAALAGATVLANLSASNITIGKAETRRLLCRSQSARCLAAYLYSAAGRRRNRPPTSPGTARPRSSRTAMLWLRPNGFPSADQAAIADIDLDMLAQERMRMGIVRLPTAAAGIAPTAVPAYRLRRSRHPPAMSACSARIERFPVRAG